MNSAYQRYFTEQVQTDEKHVQVRTALEARLGASVDFRILEVPFFCTTELRDIVAGAARELVRQCAEASFVRRMERVVPAAAAVPRRAARPLFSVVDFALCSIDGSIVPRLIELQGFPSLFGYQLMLARTFREVYGLRDTWSPLFTDMSEDEYVSLLGESIRGAHHPDNVALTEIRPHEQKTRVDFIATEQLTGVAATDITSCINVDGTLFHERAGALHPVRRIYNRAIVDELEELNVTLPFRWNDDLKVEWAGHPDWYFLMSKASLPYLRHETVPRTWLLSELPSIPADLSSFVLKPLFAFAGKGVNLYPSVRDIESIPDDQRCSWVLMEKVTYARCLPTPHGMNGVELRCMLIWPESSPEPIPTMSLVRTSREGMMGARYATSAWTGATVALFGDDDH
ncbi:MAG: hypothetical protein ACKOBV_00600 [Candidatus Kapaibacterium sp.]